jgi:hypothetical protein
MPLPLEIPVPSSRSMDGVGSFSFSQPPRNGDTIRKPPLDWEDPRKRKEILKSLTLALVDSVCRFHETKLPVASR